MSILSLTFSSNKSSGKDVAVEVDKELDAAIAKFFNSVIKTFISNWYSTITQDEAFVWNVKVEIAEAIRKIAIRLKNVSKRTSDSQTWLNDILNL